MKVSLRIKWSNPFLWTRKTIQITSSPTWHYLIFPVIANEVWQSTFVFILPRLPRFLPKPRNDMLLGHGDLNWMPARWPTW